MNMLKYLIITTLGIMFYVGSMGMALPVSAATIKICPEGQFYSIKDDQCFNLLIPEYGFQGFPEPSNVQTIGCSASDFKSLAQAGNVKIVFPAGECTIDIGDGFQIGNNTVIVGAGRDNTIIRGNNKSSDGASGLFPLTNKSNIIISKVTLDGKSNAYRPIHINGSTNIMLDQTNQFNFTSSGMHCTRDGGKYLTIRYSYINNIIGFHGIACEDQNSHISLYSNIVEKTGDYGIDLHADKLEVAGNYVDKKGEGLGMKFPDTEDMVFHHNFLANASSYRGVRTYNEVKTPGNHVYFNNYIRSGSDTSINASATSSSYFANNDVDNGVRGGSNSESCGGSNNVTFTMPDHVDVNGDEIEFYLCDISENMPGGGSGPTATPPVTTVPTVTDVPNTPVPSVTPSNCQLTGDLDCSGVVNALDLTIQITQYGQSGVSGDLDNSGKVNAIDISMLLQNFGKSIAIFL